MRAQLLAIFVGSALLVSCSSDAEAPRGALVLHIEGDVFRGDQVALKEGEHLAPNVRVKTGPEGFVLLHLSNNHVVKLESNVDVLVSEIVQLDAPRTELALEEQIKIQLSPEERARLPRSEVLAERVAGYRHQRRAGRTHGAATEASLMPSAPSAPESDDEDVAEPAAKAKAELRAEPKPAAPGAAAKPVKKLQARQADKRRKSPRKNAKSAPKEALAKDALSGLNAIGDVSESVLDVGQGGLGLVGSGQGGGGTSSGLGRGLAGAKVGLSAVPKVHAGVTFRTKAGAKWQVPPKGLRLGNAAIDRCLKDKAELVVVVVLKGEKVTSVRGKVPKAARSCLLRAWRKAKVDLADGTYGVRVKR